MKGHYLFSIHVKFHWAIDILNDFSHVIFGPTYSEKGEILSYFTYYRPSYTRLKNKKNCKK